MADEEQVEVDSCEARIPLPLAYRAGVNLKRLHVLACLECVSIASAGQVDQIFGCFVWNVREIAAPKNRDAVQRTLEEYHRRFREYGSADRAERYAEYCAALDGPDKESISDREVSDDILWPANEYLNNLRQMLANLLTGQALMASGFGQTIELGRWWFQFQLELAELERLEQEKRDLSAQSPPMLFKPNIAVSRPDRVAVICRRHTVEIVSSQSWIANVGQRLRELALAPDLEMRLVNQPAEISTLDDLIQVCNEADQVFEHVEIRENELTTPSPPWGYLDLWLDIQKGVLRRKDRAPQVSLRALACSVLKLLIDFKDDITSTAAIGTAWKGGEPPSDSVYSLISGLRKQLIELDLGIKNKSGIGYQLVELKDAKPRQLKVAKRSKPRSSKSSLKSGTLAGSHTKRKS